LVTFPVAAATGLLTLFVSSSALTGPTERRPIRRP